MCMLSRSYDCWLLSFDDFIKEWLPITIMNTLNIITLERTFMLNPQLLTAASHQSIELSCFMFVVVLDYIKLSI